MEKLNKALRALLPETIAEHCEIVNFHAQQLTIAADNASWSTQLRYHHPNLLDALQAISPELAQIKIIIRPRSAPPAAQIGKSAALSTATGAELKRCADMIQHETLKAALEKLAARANS